MGKFEAACKAGSSCDPVIVNSHSASERWSQVRRLMCRMRGSPWAPGHAWSYSGPSECSCSEHAAARPACCACPSPTPAPVLPPAQMVQAKMNITAAGGGKLACKRACIAAGAVGISILSCHCGTLLPASLGRRIVPPEVYCAGGHRLWGAQSQADGRDLLTRADCGAQRGALPCLCLVHVPASRS